MDWIQFATFLMANMVFTLTLWIWNRSESRSDIRELRAESKQQGERILSLIDAIQKEIKDFHGRLERQDADFKAHMGYYHREK